MDKIIKVRYMYIYKFMYVQNYYLMEVFILEYTCIWNKPP